MFCFRKTDNVGGDNPIRQRSNTVACTGNKLLAKSNCIEADQQHLCAFDSFLHATICSNNISLPSDPLKIQKMNNIKKVKQTPPASKLKTSVLNQLNPNLTPEQKLTRKLNDVEKWLLEHNESETSEMFNEGKAQLRENKNLLNPVNISKLPTQQAFNMENQATRKHNRSEYQSKQQKEILNTTRTQKVLENFPVSGDFSECENLLASDEDQTPTEVSTGKKLDEKPEVSSDSLSSHGLRNVIVHHHIHHYYHFDGKE